jgi:hypothetical protein
MDKEVLVNLLSSENSDSEKSEFEHVLADHFKHEKDPLFGFPEPPITKKILRYNCKLK